MRRIALALVGLLALGASAVAQWQVPANSIPLGRGPGIVGFNSVAPGTSNNCLVSNGTVWTSTACPSSGSANIIIGSTGITSGTTTRLLYDLAGVVQESSVLSLTAGGPLSINPTAASVNQGFSVTQTSPTSGSMTGPLSYNLLNVTHSIGVTGSCATIPCTSNASAFRVNMAIGNSNASGQGINAGLFNIQDTTAAGAQGDRIGLLAVSTSSVVQVNGGSFAGVSSNHLLSGATSVLQVGHEIDISVHSGAATTKRIGLSIINDTLGVVQGSTIDALIMFSNGGGNAGAFKSLFTLSNNYGFKPLADTGDFFVADTSYTVANIFNLSNVTVTSNILNFPGVTLAGTGALTATASTNAAFTHQIVNSSTGVSASASYTVQNSANTGNFGLGSTGFTDVAVLQNRTYVRNSSGGAGIVLDNAGANPIIFATSDTERARVLLGLMVGTTTDPGAGIINVLTGFRVSNAATSGNVLRGNGTNFVSSQLACADLTVACITGNQSITLSGDVTGTGATAITTVLATAQPAVHTWALAQTFTVAPIFTDQSGSRTALGLGTMATQNANAVAITGGTLAGITSIGLTSGSTINWNSDTFIGRAAAANAMFGAADAASPVAQTTSVQNVVAGTSNTAGVDWTFSASRGTGTGAGGDFVWKVAAAAGSSTTQNTLATVLRLKSTGLMNLGTDVAPLAGVLLTVNANAAALQAPIAGTVLQLSSADGANTRIGIDAFGTNKNGSVIYRSARGTAASLTATQANDLLGANFGFGYATSGGAGYVTNAGAGFFFAASENYTSSAAGASLTIVVTPTGTASQINAAVFNPSGGLSLNSATDPGIGGLQVNAQQFNPNMAADTATADSTVCTATSGGKLLKGTGTIGICLGTSSARFKNSIVPVRDGLAEIAGLVPVNFKYNKDAGDNGAREQYGFLAEDVIKVLPKLVGLDNQKKPLSVDLVGMIPVMVRAIQQLKADNDNIREQLRKVQ